MKKHTIKSWMTILLAAAIAICVQSCSSSNDIADDIYSPTEEEIAETVKQVYTQWGASKETVQQHMSGYRLVTTGDENVLQFKAKKLPLTIAYQFSSDKLCAAVMVAEKGDNEVDVKNTINGYSYIGETGSNDIFMHEAKNVFAAAYEEDSCQIIGFTPLFSTTEKVGKHECTDLGLSVKWATCNVGAESPEDYGGYYAWGETEEKDTYTRATYKYESVDLDDSICRTQYDVAQAVLGTGWAMPTKAQMDELLTKCDWVWTTENGVNGYRIFGDNGNYIFLPAAGYKQKSFTGRGTGGYYTTATQNRKLEGYAYDIEFTSSKKSASYNTLFRGLSVRAVVK